MVVAGGFDFTGEASFGDPVTTDGGAEIAAPSTRSARAVFPEPECNEASGGSAGSLVFEGELIRAAGKRASDLFLLSTPVPADTAWLFPAEFPDSTDIAGCSAILAAAFEPRTERMGF